MSARVIVRLGWAALGLALTVGPLVAQDAPPEAGTARDVILRADGAYAARRYADAAQGYQRFLADFGESAEAREFLGHVRYNLAASLMQSQKYEEAAAEIEEAQKIPAMAPEKMENLAFWRGVALMQTGDHAEARKILQAFLSQYPQSPRRQDAALLVATSLLGEDKF
jgi:TolA-binding protein